MRDAERLARLRSFGLSEYQARAYLALLELGKTEAREVSRLAKVPIAKIYHTLQQLHERGLAHMYPEKPRMFAPVPFDEFLARLRAQHEAEIATLEETRARLAAEFQVKGGASADDRGAVTVLRGRARALEAAGEMVAAARREVLLVPSLGMTQTGLAPLRAALQEASGRGVRVCVASPRPLGPVLREMGAQSEGTAPAMPVALLLADEQGLLIHFVPDDGEARKGNDIAVRIEHLDFVNALRSLASPERPRPPAEPTPARLMWTRALEEGDAHGAIARLPDGALLDVIADETTPSWERRLLAAMLRQRMDMAAARMAASPDDEMLRAATDSLSAAHRARERTRLRRERFKDARLELLPKVAMRRVAPPAKPEAS